MNGEVLLLFIAICGIIYGYCYEQQVAEWEHKTFKKLLNFLGVKD